MKPRIQFDEVLRPRDEWPVHRGPFGCRRHHHKNNTLGPGERAEGAPQAQLSMRAPNVSIRSVRLI
jgi:hypothetical protein